jgi:hypothetical protein
LVVAEAVESFSKRWVSIDFEEATSLERRSVVYLSATPESEAEM